MATAGAADVGREAKEDRSRSGHSLERGVSGVGGVGDEGDIRERDDEDDTHYGFDSEDDGHEEGNEDDDDNDVGDGAGLLLTVVSWVGGLLSSLEGLFASFGMYSKLEAAKMQAVSELEEEYGAPIDEIVEYVDDDGEVHRSSREYEAADEEAMLDGNPGDSTFDDYADPGGDEYSYAGMEFSDDQEDEEGGPREEEDVTAN